MNDVKITALNYEVDFYTVDVSQYVGGYPYNGLTFINYGTSTVRIENITLQPNQQFEISGNTGEVTTQRFFVNFGTSTTGNNVVVVRKRYLNVS
jgi:hypothetical protein